MFYVIDGTPGAKLTRRWEEICFLPTAVAVTYRPMRWVSRWVSKPAKRPFVVRTWARGGNIVDAGASATLDGALVIAKRVSDLQRKEKQS